MKQTQTELSITEYYNPLHITGQIVWKKEKEPPEYESINENTEEDDYSSKKNNSSKQNRRSKIYKEQQRASEKK